MILFLRAVRSTLAAARWPWLLGVALVPQLCIAQAAAPVPRAQLMINLRAMPDLESLIVAVLDKGDPVTVLAEQGEFARLRTQAGTEGYLKHKYLSPYTPGLLAAGLRMTEPPVLAYRSPYPAEPLVGSAPRVTRSGAPQPPVTFLSTGTQSGVHFTFGLGTVLSRFDRAGLERDLAREGFGGDVTRLDRAAPGGFLRVSYGLGTPWRAEAAVMYLDDLDVQLQSDALTPITLAQSVENHAPVTGFGVAPTLAHQWQSPGHVATLRVGGFFSLGNKTQVRLNGRPLEVDYQTHGVLAGLSWESASPSGMWGGVDVQVMHLNDLIALVGFTLRFGG